MYQDKRSYASRALYLKQAVSKRRKILLEKALHYKGGQCEKCGYNKSKRALSFHHLNPKTKSFGISAKGITRCWDKIVNELDKCILVCANCHAEIHDGIWQPPDRKTGCKQGELLEP